MVTAQDVSQAWTRIKPHVLRTSVLETDVFGMPLTLKLEQMQHTGSFKVRGAMNSLLSMDVPQSRPCRRQRRQSRRCRRLGRSTPGPPSPHLCARTGR